MTSSQDPKLNYIYKDLFSIKLYSQKPGGHIFGGGGPPFSPLLRAIRVSYSLPIILQICLFILTVFNKVCFSRKIPFFQEFKIYWYKDIHCYLFNVCKFCIDVTLFIPVVGILWFLSFFSSSVLPRIYKFY